MDLNDKIESVQFWNPTGTNATICALVLEGVAFFGEDQMTTYIEKESQEMALQEAYGKAHQFLSALEACKS